MFRKLLLFIFLIQVSCQSSLPSEEVQAVEVNAEAEEPTVDATCELAYQVLQIEEELGFEAHTSAWGVLDAVLSVQPKFEYHDSLSISQKEELLNQFDLVLNEHRNVLAEYHSVLGMSLRWKIYDCDINSMLFKSWGERWNIPIDLYLFPNHMAIGVPNEPTLFYETTRAITVDAKYYDRRHQRQRSEIYQRPLTDDEIKAVVYFNVAKEYGDKGNAYRSMVLLEYANELFPEWPLPCDIMNGLDIQEALNDYLNC